MVNRLERFVNCDAIGPPKNGRKIFPVALFVVGRAGISMKTVDKSGDLDANRSHNMRLQIDL